MRNIITGVEDEERLRRRHQNGILLHSFNIKHLICDVIVEPLSNLSTSTLSSPPPRPHPYYGILYYVMYVIMNCVLVVYMYIYFIQIITRPTLS